MGNLATILGSELQLGHGGLDLTEQEAERREVLITAAHAAAWATLERRLADRGVAPRHAFPPGCVMAERQQSAIDSIREVPGVRVVEGVLAESELATAPEELRLAAAAWNERVRSRADTARSKGRGEAWDAPGFLPPDPPPAVREYLRRREQEAKTEPRQPPGDEPDEGKK